MMKMKKTPPSSIKIENPLLAQLRQRVLALIETPLNSLSLYPKVLTVYLNRLDIDGNNILRVVFYIQFFNENYAQLAYTKVEHNWLTMLHTKMLSEIAGLYEDKLRFIDTGGLNSTRYYLSQNYRDTVTFMYTAQLDDNI